MKFHATTVEECWRIARAHTEGYQAKLNQAHNDGNVEAARACKAARDATDRVALAIRFGKKRGDK